MTRTKSIAIVIWLYLTVLAVGAGLTYYLPGDDPLAKLFFIDICLTLIVFIASFKYNNASLYDPYWSVIPFAFLFYWLYVYGLDAITIKTVTTMLLLSFWSWRLTANWLRGWKGMGHEDWRYLDLKQKTHKWYLLVNFLGIHIFPTVIVFIGTIPLYFIYNFPTETNFLTYMGFVVAFGGVVLELVADNQLYKFKIKENNPIAIMRFGVWQYLRHPNYLGEILFWVGIALISYSGYNSLLIFTGSLLILFMFIFISIPMIDNRLIKSKPGYLIYKQSTWSLIPKFIR